MAKQDFYPEFPDYGEFSLEDQDFFPTPAQAPTPEPVSSYPDAENHRDFPDYELDEYILELLRPKAGADDTEGATRAFTPQPPSPPNRADEPTRSFSKAQPESISLPDEDEAYEACAPEADDNASAEPVDAEPLRRALFDTNEPDDSDDPDDLPDPEPDDEELPPESDEEELELRFIKKVAERDAKLQRRSQPLDEKEPKHRPAAGGEEDAPVTGKTPRVRSAFAEKLKGPLVRYFATLAARKELREQEAATWPAPVPLRQTPELSPLKAMHYYATQLKPITARLLLTLVMCLASVWISLDFPMAGQLAHNPGLQAAVCLCFMLASMVAALDVVTSGARQLLRFHFGMESLAVLSCALCAVDAVLVMLNITDALPFCAIASLSLAAALWGERLFCLSTALNFGTAATAKGSCILSLEEDEESGLKAVCIRNRAYEGIVRRSEDPDISRRAYSIAAPILAAAAFVLALLGSWKGDWLGLPHRLSAYLTAACALPAFICFGLPYLAAAGRLRRAGAALAGWPGCEDLGRNRRMLVTDNDIFPAGSIRIENGQMEKSEAEWQSRIVSYTVSLLAAAGSSCLYAFDELREKHKCAIEPVEELKYHDGGGLSGYIHHENVCIGSAGFMNLNGIRPLRQVDTENGICVAIGGKFVAVITLSYTPLKGAQQALRMLARGRTQPVFAIRDFNITPLMIQKLFGIPALNFEFPSFKERFRLSADMGRPDTPAAAVLVRHSLHSAVECAERSRRLYKATVLNTVFSIAASALGMLLIFLLSQGDAAAVMGVHRLMGYMLLWTLPCLVCSYWVQR